MSAPPDPPPPRATWHHLGSSPAVSAAASERKVDERRRGLCPLSQGTTACPARHPGLPEPAPLLPSTTLPSPSPSCRPSQRELRRRRRSGGDEGGAGLGEGEGRQQPQENTHSLFCLQRRESPASYLFPASARLGVAQLDHNLQVSHFRRKHLGAHLPTRRPYSPRPSPPQLLDSRSRAF